MSVDAEAGASVNSAESLAGRTVLVLGLGITGMAVAEALAAAGARVRASEARTEGEVGEGAERLRAAGVEVETGGHARVDDWLTDVELVISSPGIAPSSDVLARVLAAKVSVVSEVELASRIARAPMIAVTGTNGKTTTCRLVGEILRHEGRAAVVCGNEVGEPFISAVLRAPDTDIFVVEVSSFQLTFCDTFRPRVSVVTNLAHDHLNWHGTMQAYRDAKARIAMRQGPGDDFVYPAAQAELARFAPEGGPRRISFSMDLAQEGVWLDDGRIVAHLPGEERIDAGAVEHLERLGRPFVEDGLAAAAAALATGVRPRAVEDALAAFRPDPHRVELAGEIDGVRFIDDSKATNPHAAVAAVRGFDDVVLIAGGRNKGLDLTPLREAANRLTAVVGYGEAGDEVIEVFAGRDLPAERATNLEHAVREAFRLARPGGVVLLSPACSSYDEFASYVHRGVAFRDAVNALSQRGGHR